MKRLDINNVTSYDKKAILWFSTGVTNVGALCL